MFPLRAFGAALLAGFVLSTAAVADGWQTHATLPQVIANNAVTTHTVSDTPYVYTFLGIDETKVWSGVQRYSARLNTITNVWESLPDVPGSVGRIAALAFAVGDKIYLFGGYSVAMNGSETSWANVDIFDPVALTWSSGTPMPKPVDDMVGGVWADSLVYLVSGWSNTSNVRDVQIYDPTADVWITAPDVPFPGTFGGAGGVVGNHIVYADGVTNAFVLTNRVDIGEINPADPTDITWTNHGAHPGPAGYRMAAGPLPGDDTRLFFTGGTDNAYNFDGIGYNSIPSEPLDWTWALTVPGGIKVNYLAKPVATMDHRTFAAATDGRLYVVGGMEASQTVTGRTSSYLADAPVSVGPANGSPENGLRLWPNPARSELRVGWVGHTAERGVLRGAALFDAAGRRIRKLDNEILAAEGFSWDLTDDAGRRVAPGVYWLRGRVFDRNISRKLVVSD